MYSNKVLTISLLISTIIHSVIFLPLHLSYQKSFFDKKEQVLLKITYLPPVKVSLKKTQPQIKRTKPFTEVVPKVDEVDKKEMVAKFKSTSQPANTQEEIEIPPGLSKEKELLYVNYYQSIREKIRRFVIKNYPHFIDCGEVRLYFVLFSNGRLKEINVIEGSSTSNHLLKEIAKRSLRQASPFTPFPRDLSRPQLSFNVIISFESEN